MCMKVKKIVNFAAFSGGARQTGEEAGGAGGGYKRILNYLWNVDLIISKPNYPVFKIGLKLAKRIKIIRIRNKCTISENLAMTDWNSV